MKVGRHGVLVTQHTNTFYTVTLSKDVPYGQIYERRLTEPLTQPLTKSPGCDCQTPPRQGVRSDVMG